MQEEPKSNQTKSFLTDILETFVIATAISIVVYFTLLIPNQVDGPSMEPNFHTNELLFTNRTIEWLGATGLGQQLHYDYQRGDVVILHSSDVDLIKRIIAGPGDTIRIEGGNVFVNGKQLIENYLAANTPTTLPIGFASTLNEGEVKRVPENRYFVMGDNRTNSKDSRFADVGFIDRTALKGKVLVRYWPIEKAGFISTGTFSEK